MTRIKESDIISIVESHNYQVINRPLNQGAKQKLVLKCPLGHIEEKKLSSFRKKPACNECYRLRLLLPLDKVALIFKQNNCELLSEKYLGNRYKLKFKCACGKEDEKDLATFKKFPFCRECGKLNTKRKNEKYSLTDIVKILDELNCKYISGYDGSVKNTIKYICPNGHHVEKILDGIITRKHGNCRICAIDSISGENHYNWKGGVKTEEREIAMSKYPYKNWRINIFIRDNRKCVCCGSNKNIVAHHLNGWNWAVDERYSADNGVTLCENCHKDFHASFGYGDNTKKQFEVFYEKDNIMPIKNLNT